LTDIVRNTNSVPFNADAQGNFDQEYLFPVFGNVVQEGRDRVFSTNKYCYSPNEIFSYFTNEFFQLGVDEEGHFQLQINKHDSKFELEISEAFLSKYDLQTETIAFQSEADVSNNEYWITTGNNTTAGVLGVGVKRYVKITTPYKQPDPFTVGTETYDKLQETHHSISSHEVSIGTHQTPEASGYGSYIYSCGGFEESLRSKGRVTVESMNTFAEIQIVSVGLGFNPMVGTESASMRVLASFEVPFPYDIKSSGNPFKVCDISVPPVGDLIVIPSTSQYLSLTSPSSIRYLRFMVQKVKRTGEADFVYLPPRGRVALKLRFLITK